VTPVGDDEPVVVRFDLGVDLVAEVGDRSGPFPVPGVSLIHLKNRIGNT